jgi:DNA-binding response OmpR family regulator
MLLVEDDENDVALITMVMERIGMDAELVVRMDGRSALEYLHDPAGPRPDLVLLDINLPDISGLDVLESIKSDPGLATTPVVILSTSGDHDDVLAAYTNWANTYIQKPADLAGFVKVFDTIEGYWLRTAGLP